MSPIIEGDVLCDPLPRPDSGPKKHHAVRDSRPRGSYTTLSRPVMAARVEVDDLAYNPGSAVTLPFQRTLGKTSAKLVDDVPWEDSKWAERYKKSSPELYEQWQGIGDGSPGLLSIEPSLDRLTLSAIAIIYKVIEQNDDLHILVAGHSEAAESEHGADLAAMRARNFLSLLAGERDGFVESCEAFNTPADFRPIGHLLARLFGWAFSAEALEKDEVALAEFRTAYNETSKVPGFAEVFKEEVPLDTPTVGAADWGALYDCYEIVLAAAAGVKTPQELSALRSRLKFADADQKSQGYEAAVRRSESARWRSRSDRRVEILFFPSQALEPLQSRGVGISYDPSVYDFIQFDPHLFIQPVEVKTEPEFSLTVEKSDETLVIEATLPRLAEGEDYVAFLAAHPPAWPGRDDRG